jgi:hypothetical protein
MLWDTRGAPCQVRLVVARYLVIVHHCSAAGALICLDQAKIGVSAFDLHRAAKAGEGRGRNERPFAILFSEGELAQAQLPWVDRGHSSGTIVVS